jgi:hypothetical protein
MNDCITSEERKGVEMIQALVKYAGDSEPEEVSLANWRKFSDAQKAHTEWVYSILFKE